MFRAAMLPAAACLLVGMALGLARLGWEFWPGWATPVTAHGPLMVGGFLGTLVALERARAVGRRVALLAPLLSGAGGLALVAGVPAPVAGSLLAAGAIGLVACYVVVLRRRNDVAGWTQLAGAFSLAVALAWWAAGREPFGVADCWVLFLVATVAGERLELTRLLPRFGARAAWFVAAMGVMAVGVVVAVVALALRQHAVWGVGARVGGLGLLAVAAWLARHDVARVGLRSPGPARITAVGLLAGYAWLAVAGALALWWGAPTPAAVYDARLHAVFLGFGVSMIFVHAPMVGRAVLDVTVPHGRWLHVPLALLHGSLAARVVGDLSECLPLRQWAALVNVVAILAYPVLAVGVRLATARRPVPA